MYRKFHQVDEYPTNKINSFYTDAEYGNTFFYLSFNFFFCLIIFFFYFSLALFPFGKDPNNLIDDPTRRENRTTFCPIYLLERKYMPEFRETNVAKHKSI